MSRPMVAWRKAAWFIGVVLVGLIAIFVLAKPKTPKVVELDQGLARVQAPALLPMDAGQVTELDLTLSGQRMVATKSGDKWMLKQPFNDEANAADIERVIGIFSALASDETVSDPESPAKYGLDRPYAKATFSVDGKTHVFTIGREGRTELYYVQTSASNLIYIVRGLPEELKVLRPIDLVNRQLLSFNPDDVVRIEADTDDPDLKRVVERRDGKWFTATGPTGIVFEVEEFLRDLRFVNICNIVSAGPAQGLSPRGSTMHIVLTRKDGKKHVLDVGNTTGDDRRYFVKSSDRPHVYQVVQFIAENLREKMQRVGTDMMGLDPDRVGELKLITVTDKPAEPVTQEKKAAATAAALMTGQIERPTLPPGAIEKILTKGDKTWTTDGKVAFSVGAVMDAVVGVTAQAAAPDADDASYGFFPAVGSVQITATLDNKATIQLDLGAKTPDGKNRYVRSSSRHGVYLSPADSVDIIQQALSRVRSELMVFEPANVTKITAYESGFDGKTSSVSLTKQGGRWMSGGKARDTEAVNSLLKELRGLGAESIPPEQDEATYGFYPAAESWRVELTFQGGGTLTLDTGARKSEGSGWFAIVNYYVRISDLSDVVFVGEFDIDGLRDSFNALTR